MTTTPSATTRDRLERLIVDGLDCRTTPLAAIARQLGVSRERVRQLLPKPAIDRKTIRTLENVRRVQAFVEEHPEALISTHLGGIGQAGVVRGTGLSAAIVVRAWQVLGLPSTGYDMQRLTAGEREERERARAHRYYDSHKSQCVAATHAWNAAHPDRLRELRVRANRRWRTKVIRTAICPACGEPFPWTNYDEMRQRRTDYPLSCSGGCGLRLAAERRRRVLA